MASLLSNPLITLLLLMTTPMSSIQFVIKGVAEGAFWCVARSDAGNQALQTALDYACSAGADCTPLLSSGLCFLPNTIQAHASYAFNGFFQRKAMASASCDFSGTATIAQTDLSYGSCVYPSSLSTARGATTPATTSTNPNTPTMPGAMTPPSPDNNSKACSSFMIQTIFLPLILLFVISFTLLTI